MVLTGDSLVSFVLIIEVRPIRAGVRGNLRSEIKL